jgi:hypothetical protein
VAEGQDLGVERGVGDSVHYGGLSSFERGELQVHVGVYVKAKLQGKLSDGKHGRLSVHGRPLMEKNRGRRNWRSKIMDVYTVDCRESRRVVVPGAGQNGRTFLRSDHLQRETESSNSAKHPQTSPYLRNLLSQYWMSNINARLVKKRRSQLKDHSSQNVILQVQAARSRILKLLVSLPALPKTLNWK